ncbi:MAG TPA: ABC transporter permease [Acidimicrobiia bacterium]|nr:ABC transporter permease [Acidimicrobiia bacterium]
MTAAPEAIRPDPGSENRDIRGFFRRYAGQAGITVAFLLLWLLFVLFAPDTFLSGRIYAAFAATVPMFAIVAIPLTLMIVAGEIDLSFPSTMGLGMVGFVLVWEATGNVSLGVLAALVIGAAAGLFNGLIVVYVNVPALVVTIGTLFVFRGLELVIIGGRNVSLVATRASLPHRLLVGELAGIPTQLLWLLVVAVIGWVFLNRHRFGAAVYVIGDNRDTADLMGIHSGLIRILLFVIVGVAAAFAGILSSLFIDSFFPTVGEGQLLPALAAVFVGGTSVFGGKGTIYGTVLGAFMIGAIAAGIIAAGLTGFYTEFVFGLVIVVSVSVHAIVQRRVG